MYRTYILRLKPNKTQTKLLDKTISCVQKFDDIYLNQIKDKYTCSGFEIIKEARNIDSDLATVDNTILFCELDIIQKLKKEKKLANRFEFKTNYCKYVESIEDVISNHTLYLPSIGHIILFNKRDYDEVEKFISITVYRTIDEKYFANVLFRKKNKTVDKNGHNSKYTYLRQQTNDVTANGEEQNVYIIGVENQDELMDFVTMQDRKTKEKVKIQNDGVVITEKL